MAQTPSSAQMYGRIGGLRTRASHNPADYASPAQRASAARFERQVDPDGTLPLDERKARAEALRKSYMTELSLRGVSKRAAKRARIEQRLRTLEQIVGLEVAEGLLDG